ncbi:MAG: hypothetical protein ACRYGF_16685 [Janthinobacterium lividum]
MDSGSAREVVNSRARVKRVARLRRWLLGGLVGLLLVLGSLLGYTRYRAHRFLADLPRRLGIDIKSETNGFTLSQSSKGHTLFTVHAAKAIQRENGKTTLHDVAITLYGAPGSNRTDSIRGEEFEYDQPNGVVRAAGEVHLDLAAPVPNGVVANPNAKRIAVTTRGLVLMQKLGIAATDEPIQIVYGDIRGGATGADYESDTGMLRLRKDVRLDGMRNGKAVHVDAAAAELDRTTQTGTLHHADVRSDGSRSSGERMTFLLGKGGGIQTADAEGNVVLQGEHGTRAEAPHMHAQMDTAGKLQTATMGGGVRFRSADTTGSATEALLRFSAAGNPEQLDLQHAVQVNSAGGAAGGHSTLSAQRVLASLMQNGKRTALREAVASGGAQLQSVQPAVYAAGAKQKPDSSAKQATTRTTLVSAQTLHATTALSNGARYVSTVDGAGDTRIVESDDLGNRRTSSGDNLQATLLPPPGKNEAPRKETGTLRAAIQTGHVVVTQHVVPGEKVPGPGSSPGVAAQDSQATAQRAEFDNVTQQLVLSGEPVVTAPGVQLAADRVTMAQAAGDMQAVGTVKGTLIQQGADGKSELVHVLADHASIAGAGGSASFFGGAKPVRMWSSTAQLQAPEMHLDRAKGTLSAKSLSTEQPAVHLVLANASSGSKQAPTRQSGTVQVTGRNLVMTGSSANAPGHIDVSEDVRVLSAGSDLKANHVVATLKPQGGGSGSSGRQVQVAGDALSGGSMQSILATGDVHLQQPGRTGSGQRLLYTESDGRYELSGTPAAPPTMVDSLQGSVTGTTLIFHSGDDSVEVAGETGRRVHTETHAARPTRSR